MWCARGISNCTRRRCRVQKLQTCACQQQRQYGVQQHCWPQKRPHPLTSNSEVQEVQRDKQSVGRHPAKGRARRFFSRPTSYSERQEANASHAANCCRYSGQLRSQQQARDEGGNDEERHAGGSFGQRGDSERFVHELAHCAENTTASVLPSLRRRSRVDRGCRSAGLSCR